MNNILKTLREAAGMTQEAVADTLDVTVNTIQNWERSDRLAKESLHELMDLYDLDQQKRKSVVLAIFGMPQNALGRVAEDNFPYFLVADKLEVLEAVERVVLTEEEMEIFGYSYFVCKRTRNGLSKGTLDYTFFREHGGHFETMKILNCIEAKIGNFMEAAYSENRFAECVYQYGLLHPGEGFSLAKLDAYTIEQQIENLPLADRKNKVEISGLGKRCQAVREPVLIGTSVEEAKDVPNIVSSMYRLSGYYRTEYSFELKLNDVCSRCFVIEKRELSSSEYLKKKEQYLSDKKVYDEHPDLYEREPAFKLQFEFWLKLSELGARYLEWYTS